MNISTFMASIVWMVSAKLSPLTTEEVEPPILRESAERRFSASSKELRVRVEGSRKRFTMVRPRRAGTFLMERLLTSAKERAVSKIWVISSAVSDVVSIRLRTESIRRHLRCASRTRYPRSRRPHGHPGAPGTHARPRREKKERFCRHNRHEWAARGGRGLP